ncbi:MAG: hypothetical protein N2491_04420 [Negativicutes bacterium]|nr:hypothetical protein [Negativicutes bacterium]
MFRSAKQFFKRLTQDTFNRDLLILMVVSIVIGSLLAGSIAMGANAYFSKTLSSLVGDYGEYDVVIQVRENMKADAMLQLQKIIDDALPGGKLKEGPTLTGKTNLFVALPAEYKTKKTYDDLGKIFGSIPGGAGVGVMTEPRITLKGVPEGAKNLVIERIMQMDGVKFAFRDGGSIGVILVSLDKAPAVNEEIKAMLKEYQVIEISFPVGNEPANPIRTGEGIAREMQNQLGLKYATNVSVDGRSDSMTYMVSTMMELKRFLSAYASQVILTPAAGVKLLAGDTLVFQGTAPTPPETGAAPQKNNVLVQVKAIRSDGSAEGIIIQGDASELGNGQGYKLEKNVIAQAAATAAYRNPRQQLGNALSETAKLAAKVPGFAQDTQNLSQIALGALDNYGASIKAIEQTLSGLQAAGGAIQAATGGLANIDTGGIQAQLDNSSRALGGMVGTLQVLKLVNPEVAGTIESISGAQRNLNNLKSGLAALDNVATDARRAKSAIDSIVANGNTTVAALKSFDVNGARTNLTNVTGRLAELQQINAPLIAAQLEYMAAAAPNLRDEEITHSINLLDQFIAGQVIPGERIQILTTSSVSLDAVAPVVYKQVGHNNVSLYATALGIIEPNARGEVMQILAQVKAILAGMTAIIATILFLVLDHTAVMTAMRRKRLAGKVKKTGWRGVVARLAVTYTAPERQYGMLVGAVLLTAIFIITGGGIPYLPWIGVPFLGALLGLTVAAYTEKISPIASDEVTAGEALGLSFDEIMREIVVPSGRPGLLQKLNNRKLKFK